MTPIGTTYRAEGSLEPKSIFITLILGVTAAVLGAALVWTWEWSGIPTLVIITPLLQALGVGMAMAFAIGRLRVRNPRLVGLVAFACGLLSALLVHYGHYMHLVSAASTSLREDVSKDATLAPDRKQQILAQLDENPSSFIDATLKARTGYSGFIGSLILRGEDGVRIKSMNLTGIGVYILWSVEAIVVGCVAASMAAARAGQPFCEDCGYWCEKQDNVLALLPDASTELAEVMKEDRPQAMAALRSKAANDMGAGATTVALHSCPGCELTFADVSLSYMSGKETKVKPILKATRVSPELAAIIRTPPAPEPTPAGAAVEELDANTTGDA